MVSKEENKKSEAAQRPVDAKSAMAGREERVLEFWKEKKIFERSLQQSEGKREFIFYQRIRYAFIGVKDLQQQAITSLISR